MPYFERAGPGAFAPTPLVSGSWSTDEQHVAPLLGLLAHLVETDRDARRDDGLVLARLSFDILGTLPLEPVETRVRVVRPGRSVELVEAVAAHAGRDAVVLRAWLMRQGDTSSFRGTALGTIPGPEATPPWDPTQDWRGGFIASVEVRREQEEPGRARSWVRTEHALLADEPVSALAAAVGLLDIANGMTPRAHPDEVAFPNLDLTVHLFRGPGGGWTGCDTSVSFGPDGIGLTSSVLHDADGPMGTCSQILTVRPR